MKRLAFAVALAGVMHAHVASGQSLAVEVDQTVGHSTEGVSAAGTQLRTFGEVTPMIRFKVEAAWAARSADEGDAFEAAYPYAEHLQVIEAYGERLFAPGHGVLAIRVGRYRTPFGISSASDHAYSGFLRAPLIRYDDYYALSNNFSSTARTSWWEHRGFPSRPASAFQVTSAKPSAAKAWTPSCAARARSGRSSSGSAISGPGPTCRLRLPRGTPSSVASTPAGCAAACRCVGNGFGASRSTAREPTADTSTSSFTVHRWAR
jgi:hypothetical protein